MMSKLTEYGEAYFGVKNLLAFKTTRNIYILLQFLLHCYK